MSLLKRQKLDNSYTVDNWKIATLGGPSAFIIIHEHSAEEMEEAFTKQFVEIYGDYLIGTGGKCRVCKQEPPDKLSRVYTLLTFSCPRDIHTPHYELI